MCPCHGCRPVEDDLMPTHRAWPSDHLVERGWKLLSTTGDLQVLPAFNRRVVLSAVAAGEPVLCSSPPQLADETTQCESSTPAVPPQSAVIDRHSESPRLSDSASTTRGWDGSSLTTGSACSVVQPSSQRLQQAFTELSSDRWIEPASALSLGPSLGTSPPGLSTHSSSSFSRLHSEELSECSGSVASLSRQLSLPTMSFGGRGDCLEPPISPVYPCKPGFTGLRECSLLPRRMADSWRRLVDGNLSQASSSPPSCMLSSCHSPSLENGDDLESEISCHNLSNECATSQTLWVRSDAEPENVNCRESRPELEADNKSTARVRLSSDFYIHEFSVSVHRGLSWKTRLSSRSDVVVQSENDIFHTFAADQPSLPDPGGRGSSSSLSFPRQIFSSRDVLDGWETQLQRGGTTQVPVLSPLSCKEVPNNPTKETRRVLRRQSLNLGRPQRRPSSSSVESEGLSVISSESNRDFWCTRDLSVARYVSMTSEQCRLNQDHEDSWSFQPDEILDPAFTQSQPLQAAMTCPGGRQTAAVDDTADREGCTSRRTIDSVRRHDSSQSSVSVDGLTDASIDVDQLAGRVADCHNAVYEIDSSQTEGFLKLYDISADSLNISGLYKQELRLVSQPPAELRSWMDPDRCDPVSFQELYFVSCEHLDRSDFQRTQFNPPGLFDQSFYIHSDYLVPTEAQVHEQSVRLETAMEESGFRQLEHHDDDQLDDPGEQKAVTSIQTAVSLHELYQHLAANQEAVQRLFLSLPTLQVLPLPWESCELAGEKVKWSGDVQEIAEIQDVVAHVLGNIFCLQAILAGSIVVQETELSDQQISAQYTSNPAWHVGDWKPHHSSLDGCHNATRSDRLQSAHRHISPPTISTGQQAALQQRFPHAFLLVHFLLQQWSRLLQLCRGLSDYLDCRACLAGRAVWDSDLLSSCADVDRGCGLKELKSRFQTELTGRRSTLQECGERLESRRQQLDRLLQLIRQVQILSVSMCADLQIPAHLHDSTPTTTLHCWAVAEEAVLIKLGSRCDQLIHRNRNLSKCVLRLLERGSHLFSTIESCQATLLRRSQILANMTTLTAGHIEESKKELKRCSICLLQTAADWRKLQARLGVADLDSQADLSSVCCHEVLEVNRCGSVKDLLCQMQSFCQHLLHQCSSFRHSRSWSLKKLSNQSNLILPALMERRSIFPLNSPPPQSTARRRSSEVVLLGLAVLLLLLFVFPACHSDWGYLLRSLKFRLCIPFSFPN